MALIVFLFFRPIFLAVYPWWMTALLDSWYTRGRTDPRFTPFQTGGVFFGSSHLFSRTSLLRTILLVSLQAYKGHMTLTQKSRARLVRFLYTGASHVCFQQKSATEWGVSIHGAGAGAVKVHEIGRKCRDASFLLRISWVYRVFLPLCTLESPEICWL